MGQGNPHKKNRATVSERAPQSAHDPRGRRRQASQSTCLRRKVPQALGGEDSQ